VIGKQMLTGFCKECLLEFNREYLIMGICEDCWDKESVSHGLTGGVEPIEKKPSTKSDDCR